MIPEPTGDEAVYLFLDELAADGVISLNGAVKPYSRQIIRQKLGEAAARPDSLAALQNRLTPRQQKELDFWLNIYSPGEPDGKFKLLLSPATAYYRDSLFSVTVSPILGLTGGITSGSDGGSGSGTGSTSRQRTIAWKNGAKAYGN